jgi:hypothetical protein
MQSLRDMSLGEQVAVLRRGLDKERNHRKALQQRVDLIETALEGVPLHVGLKVRVLRPAHDEVVEEDAPLA